MRIKRETYEKVNDLLVAGTASFADIKLAYPELLEEVIHAIYLRKAHHDARSSLRKISALKLRIDHLYNVYQIFYPYAPHHLAYIVRFKELSEKKQGAENIIEMMAEHYFKAPPCIMARMVLKSYLSKTLHGTNAIAAGASKYLTSPDEIEDKLLSVNIARCIEIDEVYSPKMDIYRQYDRLQCY